MFGRVSARPLPATGLGTCWPISAGGRDDAKSVPAAAPPETLEERADWIFNELNGYGDTRLISAQLDLVCLTADRDL